MVSIEFLSPGNDIDEREFYSSEKYSRHTRFAVIVAVTVWLQKAGGY
jgi:hypothetical protein